MTADLTVIVPTAGGADQHGQYVDRCLASVRAAAPDAEILVVVNERDRELGRRLRDAYGAKMGVTTGPFNYSLAHNAGAAKAGREKLLFLNDDVEAHPGYPYWLDCLLLDLDAPEVGIVGATLLHEDGTVQHAGMGITDRGVPHHFHYGERGYQPTGRHVEALTGACLVTTRTVHDAVGGFDERFALCFSDTDYCLKVRAAGLEVWLSEAVLVHHEWGTRGGPQTGMADSRLWYQRWWDLHATRQTAH